MHAMIALFCLLPPLLGWPLAALVPSPKVKRRNRAEPRLEDSHVLR